MNRQRLFRLVGVIASALLYVMGMAPAGAAQPPVQAVVHAAQPDLPEQARGLPMGGVLRVNDIEIEGETFDTLDLSRFRVFSADAEIVVDNAYSLSPPNDAYYRGTVEGEPESVAVLVVPESGDPEGMILGPKGIWKIGKRKGPAAAALAARKLKESELAPLKDFRCGIDDLGLAPEPLQEDAEGSLAGVTDADAAAAVISYTARVAVETDYELYAKFNNVDAAATYVGSLFAYISSIYEAETATSLSVSFLRLWTDGAGADPWTVTSDTSSALSQFRSYWNTHETGRERTIAHMLSGKGLGGGVAWVGVLCNSSYGYGLSASLTRTTVVTTQTVWDTMVVAHEIGHNFNSPHTHCYAGESGEPSDIDHCYGSSSGCYSGSTSLPGIDSAAGGTAGAGNGTIMSYCHLLGGGYGNITMTFGLDHQFGVAAYRVPQKMSAHVQSRAQSYPNCLASIGDGPLLTVSKDGTGNGSVTSNPVGIDCGLDCSSSYTLGTVVQLTAVADAGSELSGWSGDCSGIDKTASVTMDGNNACTATFASLCGNGVKDAGEQCDYTVSGSVPAGACGGCSGTATCTTSCTINTTGCYNGICDGGTENCNTCPQECASGTAGGAVCGNGLCEAGNEENCETCPADCAGVTGGKPSRRYCCGFNDGLNPNGCGDSRCSSSGFTCTTDQAPGAPYCCGNDTCEAGEGSSTCQIDCGTGPYCGDGICNGDETSCTCGADCGAPPSAETNLCSDGLDNDCGGGIDCADADCNDDDACKICTPVGQSCATNADCCSNDCHRRKKVCR